MDTPDLRALNPFESPALTAEEHPENHVVDGQKKRKNLARLFVKWMAVCGVSAAPSFVVACGFDGDAVPRVLGMLTAILVFAGLYTVAERTSFVQNLLEIRLLRIVAWIGYGTRIAITILFPIGLTIDMICGVFAISIAAGLTGFAFDAGDGTASATFLILFGWYFLTTCIQGVILNVVLFAYMTLVWMIGIAVSAIKNGRAVVT